jgi:hypothetical protein
VGIHDHLGRLLHEAIAANGTRQVLSQRKEIIRRWDVTSEPAKGRLHRPGTQAEHAVVDLLRKLQSGTGVVETRPKTPYPREATVHERRQGQT